jgi:hypothetical protein
MSILWNLLVDNSDQRFVYYLDAYSLPRVNPRIDKTHNHIPSQRPQDNIVYNFLLQTDVPRSRINTN